MAAFAGRDLAPRPDDTLAAPDKLADSNIPLEESMKTLRE